ncbi:MAG: outer membrane protein [Vicinamibacterales bacterium]
MSRRFVLWTCLLGGALVPAPASADWFASGFAGAVFGGQVSDPPRYDFGGSFGWLSASRFGFEVDASHTPDFFEIEDVPEVLFSESSVTTVMFNGIFQLPGGSPDSRLRPYVSGGAGWMRARIGADADFIRARNSHVGINAGGGAHFLLSDRWGAGGDVRYFRDLQDLEGESEFFSLGDQKVDFWRATASFVVRF